MTAPAGGRDTGTGAPAPALGAALLYRRVSSDEQAREGLSLDSQKQSCRRYALSREWPIAGEYEDVLSGLDGERPAYRRLLDDAQRLRREGKHVVVVVAWLDRLGRAVYERARCAEELRAAGVPIHSVMEGGEIPELVANILAAVAEDEVRRIVSRVTAVREHVTAAGWRFGGAAPWGYRLRPPTADERRAGAPRSVLDEDPATAPSVREAWRRLAGGESARSVERWARRLPAEARGGRRFARGTLARMLRSAVYVGRREGGASSTHSPLERPRCRWPALIDDGTWAAVYGQEASRPRQTKTARWHLLSGLVRCGRCGLPMAGTAGRRQRAQYSCAGRNQPYEESVCRETAAARQVEALAVAEISRALDAVAAAGAAYAQAWACFRSAETDVNAAARGNVVRQRLARVRDRWADAAALYVDGDMTRATYERRRARLAGIEQILLRRLDAAEREASASPPLPGSTTIEELPSEWNEAQCASDPGRARTMIALFIESLAPQRERPGLYTAHVTWTALGRAVRASAAPWMRGGLPPAEADVRFQWHLGHTGRELAAAAPRRGSWKAELLQNAGVADLARLTAVQQRVARLFCGHDTGRALSWQEIGERLGISSRRVGQVLAEAVVQIAGPSSARLVGLVAVACTVCGTEFAVRPFDARRAAAHVCGASCRGQHMSRLASSRGRPHAVALAALPSAAFDTLHVRAREILMGYYGLAGAPRQSMAKLAAHHHVSLGTVVRSIRESEASVLLSSGAQHPSAPLKRRP